MQQHVEKPDKAGDTKEATKSYLRFGAMILTSGIAMFFVMYLNSFQLSHATWSETRFYMTFVMVAVMAVIMLGFMLNMYENSTINLAILGASVLVFAGALWLVRSQETVQESSWMSAMIPHHSIAILTSERAEISDVRACELAREIIEAQQREIAEMKWLIEDIEENGVAGTPSEAEARPVPEFAGTSNRSCP